VKYEKNYSTMKIVEISGETVFFSENEHFVSSISKTYEIDKDENYNAEELLKYTTGELRDMKNKGIITSIRRK
jgi:translation elongation factor EF-Ts